MFFWLLTNCHVWLSLDKDQSQKALGIQAYILNIYCIIYTHTTLTQTTDIGVVSRISTLASCYLQDQIMYMCGSAEPDQSGLSYPYTLTNISKWIK